MPARGWVRGTFLALVTLAVGAAAAYGASDPPWRQYGPNPGPLTALQETLAGKRPNMLCEQGRVRTESPLDKAELDARWLAEFTPALAQTAGLVSMVAGERRDAVRATAVRLLQSRGRWSAAAQDGYFDGLLHRAAGVRAKAAQAAALLGGVTGGLIGVLGGRFYDDVVGSYGYGGQWSVAGVPMGREAAGSLLRTEFAISDDDALVESVVDLLVQHPCELSSTDALKALRI